VHSTYSGIWCNEILDENGTVQKTDRIVMKHRGHEIYGKIHRQTPEEQIYRKYHFRGHVRGNSILVIYWSDDPTIMSYGSSYVEQIEDFKYEGFYLSKSSMEDTEKIEAKPLRMSKLHRPSLLDRMNGFFSQSTAN